MRTASLTRALYWTFIITVTIYLAYELVISAGKAFGI